MSDLRHKIYYEGEERESPIVAVGCLFCGTKVETPPQEDIIFPIICEKCDE